MTQDRKNEALYDIAKYFEMYDQAKFMEEYKKYFLDQEDRNIMQMALDKIIKASKLFLDGRLGELDTARIFEENYKPFEEIVNLAVEENKEVGKLAIYVSAFTTGLLRFINITKDEGEIDRPGGGIFGGRDYY